MKKKKICIYPPFKDILSKKIYPFPNQNIAKKGVRKILSKQI